jgi:hypothetical protein
MWTKEDTFNAELGYAIRMVATGHATPEQAAAMCGVSIADIQAMLTAWPQPRLQEVDRIK